MDMFYEWLGQRKSSKIRLAVMDMWKAFEESARANIPQAAILYDKFHVVKHLGEALDTIRKQEYTRLAGRTDRSSRSEVHVVVHKENLTLPGRKALKKLLTANKRLNTAYLLKESFGQLWDYRTEGWARRSSITGRHR